MYELPILPFLNNFKNFSWSLQPSDSHPPVSPPFWKHIAKSDFLIFDNHISRDHISDLWTGIFSVRALNATFHCHCFTLFQCFSLPPFWRHIAESDFLIFANRISRDHISDHFASTEFGKVHSGSGGKTVVRKVFQQSAYMRNKKIDRSKRSVQGLRVIVKANDAKEVGTRDIVIDPLFPAGTILNLY